MLFELNSNVWSLRRAHHPHHHHHHHPHHHPHHHHHHHHLRRRRRRHRRHHDRQSLYITLCGNVSVGLAFYGLVSFYHAIMDELAWCDPWPKFLCIKGVVFMTFWQVGVGLYKNKLTYITFFYNISMTLSLNEILVCNVY